MLIGILAGRFPTSREPSIGGKAVPVWAIVLGTLVLFGLLETNSWALFDWIAGKPEGASYLLALGTLRWLPWLIVPYAAACLLFGARNGACALGLCGSPLTGLAVALAITLPNLLVFAVFLDWQWPDDPLRKVLQYSVFPGIFEEVLYRAFLFGFLFRYARWGFLPAALTSAVLFGAAHIWQGGDYIEAAGVFAITGLGGLLFAWLYAEWHFNIWVPAGVHLLMNLWFQFFAMPDDGSGEIYALAGRLVVFVPAIGLTLWMARRRGHRVVKETVWLRGRPRHSRI